MGAGDSQNGCNVMKRLLLATVIVLALTFTTAGVVSADGGPHGSYTTTTDACAWCHRANTGSEAELFVASDTYTLCMSCHGAGMGANTDVANGVYLSSRDDSVADRNVGGANTPDGAALLGGGFVTYKGIPVTSSHDPTGTATAAPGNGGVRGETADLFDGAITCTSCHDPHGSSNYRILRETINGYPVSVAQVDEGAAKDYDTEQWGEGMNSLCAACHQAYYVTTAGSGSDDALVATGGYTHRVGMPYNYDGNSNPETVGYEGYHLPLAQSGNGDLVVCMTCHLPHGSSAQVTAGGTGSALLRLDNGGVCQVCHQK